MARAMTGRTVILATVMGLSLPITGPPKDPEKPRVPPSAGLLSCLRRRLTFANVLTFDETRRMTVDVAKLPDPLRTVSE